MEKNKYLRFYKYEIDKIIYETNKKFEEFMPSKYKEHLTNYMEGIKKGFIY